MPIDYPLRTITPTCATIVLRFHGWPVRSMLCVCVETVSCLVPAGLLHWFTSPYVRRLVFDRSSGTVELHTLSVLAQPQTTRIHLSEVRYPDTLRPQVTFKVGTI